MKTKNKPAPVKLSRNIAGRLLEALYILDIMETLAEGDGKSEILIKMLKHNIKPAFDEIEECRRSLFRQNKICSAEGLRP